MPGDNDDWDFRVELLFEAISENFHVLRIVDDGNNGFDVMCRSTNAFEHFNLTQHNTIPKLLAGEN